MPTTNESPWRNATYGELELVSEYFGITDTSRFKSQNNGILRISRVDDSTGYTFVYPTQGDSDHESRLKIEMDDERKKGKSIEMYFVDKRDGMSISGFFWRKN